MSGCVFWECISCWNIDEIVRRLGQVLGGYECHCRAFGFSFTGTRASLVSREVLQEA